MKRIATYDNRYKQAVETRRMILIVLLALGCVLLLPLLAAIAYKTDAPRKARSPSYDTRQIILPVSRLPLPSRLYRPGRFFRRCAQPHPACGLARA